MVYHLPIGRYLEDEVLNGVGADGVDWLVVFYPDPKKSYTVYTALRIEQLAKTVRGETEDETFFECGMNFRVRVIVRPAVLTVMCSGFFE